MSALGMADVIAERTRVAAELAAHREAAKAQEQAMLARIASLDADIAVRADGLDADLIALAETVLVVRGSYRKAGGDVGTVLADAIAQIATGEKRGYRGLWFEAFGVKDYACWSGQRSDHEYGYGPKHGSIVFDVGLKREVRKRDPKELTDAERDACVYYLTNIARIEAARAGGAA